MKEEKLAVQAVFIKDITDPGLPIRAASYLNSLSEPEWFRLRNLITCEKRLGNAVVTCAECNGLVYARLSRKGTRHFYHSGTEKKDCIWGDARARNVNWIDAEKFQGRQEGERHKTLKKMIYENLCLDKLVASSGVGMERYTKDSNNKSYAYPDVYAAMLQDAPAAFELQLSTTQATTIERRETFYSKNGIRLMWVVGSIEKQLGKTAFKEIYMRNDGQIFGMDEDVLETARKKEIPHFRLYRLLPNGGETDLIPVWKDKIVSINEINWGNPGDHPKSKSYTYDAYFDQITKRNSILGPEREKFYDALYSQDKILAKKTWNDVAKIVGGRQWEQLKPYNDIPGCDEEIMTAMGVLATVQRRKLTVQTLIDPSDLKQIINSMLLEPVNRRCWSKAFKYMVESMHPDLLLVQSINKKLERNLSETREQVSADYDAGQVFNVFFPAGAFMRYKACTET